MRLIKEKLFTERVRVTRLIIISLAMNFVLFLLSYWLNLPLWLDTTGTIYISCIVGFPTGFLVAIIMNITESVWIYGESSLLFYFVSLLTALTSGVVYSKFKDTKIKKWAIMFLSLVFVDCLSATLITYCVSDGVPSNYWSRYLFTLLQNNGYGTITSTAISVSFVKCLDIIVTLLVVIVAIKLTPYKLKSQNIVLIDVRKDD